MESTTNTSKVLQNITNSASSIASDKKKDSYPSKDLDLIDNNHSDQDDEGEDDSDESEEGCDIEFPRESAQDLHQYLHRELNNLQNMEDGQKRKFALIKLYQIFIQAKNKAPNKIYQELLPMIQKALFKRLFDKIEKCRELAALLIKEFFVRSDDITMSIPYLMPILVQRLNAEDLEGTETVPDVMKPPITQKPQVMIDPPESSEEVRVVLAEIVTQIVSGTVFDCLRAYIDQIVNIIRALCMDPFGDVIIEGCSAMSEFCQNGADQLLHFSENMARSLFTSFISKHAKVRIAGLKALYQVFFCGVWKYNANIMEHLIGFRDPNLVPIRDFYEISTKLNYFALFVADRSTVVRDHFYKTIANLSMKLPDKKDHEGRFFPYLISGLYDQNDGIRETVFDLIEELGKQYEEEYEKDIRELKQLGFQPEWSFEGKVKDSDLLLPLPFVHRPGLGARILVRSYVRRYLQALYKEINDWIQDNRERASHLMLCCIVYTEDFMTQFMDHLLVSLYKAVLEKENKVVMKNVPLCLKLIGRYCSPKAYGTLIIQAIRNELASYYPHTQSGALKAFGYIMAGTIEIFPVTQSLAKVDEVLTDFVKAVNQHVLDSMDQELADNLIETLANISDVLIAKQDKGLDIKLWHKHQKDFFYMIIRALGVYSNFKLLNKPDTEHIVAQKKKCIKLLNNLTLISGNPDRDFFDYHLRAFFNEEFPDAQSIDAAKDWAIMNHKWRMYYVIFDFLEGEKHFLQYLDSEATITVFSVTAQILMSILSNSESKNFNVKQLAISQLIPQFINKTRSFITPQISHRYLQILHQAALNEWKSPDDKSKNILLILKQHKNLIECSGVIITEDNLEQFDEFMTNFTPFHLQKKENIKVETLQVIQEYLQQFYKQVLGDKSINDKLRILVQLKFVKAITDELIKYLTDYHDSVREQAQSILSYLLKSFLMLDGISFDQEQDNLLQILRANAQMGWSSQMTQKLKDAAEMEAAMAKHVFNDPQQYVKNVIAVMMDETHGRENLIQIIKEFNKKLPFMVLNDFRIAHATNSLRRVDILRELIFKY